VQYVRSRSKHNFSSKHAQQRLRVCAGLRIKLSALPNFIFSRVVLKTIKYKTKLVCMTCKFNEYLVDTKHNQQNTQNRRLATGVHRLLVQNPDPADTNCLASWYGVRLRVRLHRWTPLTRNEQGILTRRPLVFDEFSVMFDPREAPDNFLWNLATARLPFAQWKFIDLCVGRDALAGPSNNNGFHRTYRFEAVGGPQQADPGQIWRVWPKAIEKDEKGKRRRDEDSEQAAQDGLNEVQKVATQEAQLDLRMRERNDQVLGVHSLEWCLDIVAKQEEEPSRRRSWFGF